MQMYESDTDLSGAEEIILSDMEEIEMEYIGKSKPKQDYSQRRGIESVTEEDMKPATIYDTGSDESFIELGDDLGLEEEEDEEIGGFFTNEDLEKAMTAAIKSKSGSSESDVISLDVQDIQDLP